VVPGGHAAVVRAVETPDATLGTYYLVTDLGVRYPLGSSAVLPMLGFSGARPVPVPAEVLALLPTGPGLHPQVAREVVGS
jgi:hypothetical protein